MAQPPPNEPPAGGVAFLGDSITAGGRWQRLFPGVPTLNFGVDGERSDHLLARLQPVIRARPSKLFLLIGTNDLGWGIDEDRIVANVARILDQLRAGLPDCTLYLQTVLPRDASFTTRIQALNRRYAALARERGIALLDLFTEFDDGSGRLRRDLTGDDLHLLEAGYAVWRDAIAQYVNG
jgi:lysophospholipase L1-like esterase